MKLTFETLMVDDWAAIIPWKFVEIGVCNLVEPFFLISGYPVHWADYSGGPIQSHCPQAGDPFKAEAKPRMDWPNT